MISLLFPLWALAAPLFQFSYEPVEGEAASACEFKQINDLPDYAVKCKTPYDVKTYTAHVVVREYQRAGDTGAEVLYWVTEPGEPNKYHSTSALLHLTGKTSLSDFSLSQGVENDMASLVLSWKK